MVSTKTDVIEQIKKLHISTHDANSVLGLLIPRIEAGDISLHEVVDALGSSLTHTNHMQRNAGTRFLADVLHAFPQSALNQEEICFITAFLVDRFKDHHSITPTVIYAILGLIEYEKIERKEVVSILQGVFKEVHCQSQIMTDRRNIYTFFKYCLLNRIEAVQELGTDFVLGFITAMDGEKDPRNLVLLFGIIPVITKCLPLGPFTEELFEVVAAYFPIDFIPPDDDPFGISAEDLVLGLRQALSSTSSFAPFCIPLIQEKLDSDLTSAKLDALHTLVSCCEMYSAEDIRPHVSPLWISLRREVIEGNSEEAESAALSALTAVLMALERGTVTQAARDAMVSLTNSALNECMGHLTAPEQRLMYPSAQLLIAIVVASPGPAQSILEKVMPLLVQQFVKKTEETARKNTITILAKFMEQAAKFPIMKEDAGVLDKYENICWEAFSQGLPCDSPAVQEATVIALTTAMAAFTAEHLSQAADTMTSLLITVNNNSLRDCIIRSFVALSQVQPETVSEQIWPQLLREMEQGNSRICGVSDCQILETLAILTTGKLLLQRVLPVLWSRAEETLKTSVENSCLHLSCVQKILKNSMNDCECQRYILEEWSVITKVVGLAVVIISQNINNPLPVLQCVSGISRTVVTHMKDSRPILESLVRLSSANSEERSGPFKELVSAYPDLISLASDFADVNNQRAAYLVYVYEGFLIGLHKNVYLEGLEQLLGKLCDLSIHAVNSEQRKTSSILQASLVNKMPLGPSFTRVLTRNSEEVNSALAATNSTEKRQAALQLLTWTCKALVLRGAQEEALWTKKMQSMLCDQCLGMSAAQSFEVILKEHEYALQPETFANIRLLYKQRYFENNVGPLVDLFNSTTDSASKQRALLAVSSLLPHLPHLVLSAHIKRLLPVLLQGVTCGEVAVMESTLSTLSMLLRQSALHAAQYTSTLVPNLLLITVNQSLGIRIKALECLQALASLPAPSLLPYKHDVTRGLRPVLNDKKRVIRKAAVSASTAWLLVGAPGSS